VRGALGVLHGQGGAIARPGDASRPWADVGLLARVRWALTSRIFIDMQGGALVTLVRDRFHFEMPEVAIHKVPAIGATGSVSVGAFFW
jgi:hypothetical protein